MVSNPFKWFFFWAQVVSSHTWTDQNARGPSTDLQGSFSLQLSFLWYSVLSTLATLSSTDFLCCLLTGQSLLGFPEHPSLLCGLEHTSTQSSDSMKGSLNVILSLRHHCPLLPHVQCHTAYRFIYFVCFSLVPDGCVNIMFIPSRPEVEVTSFLFNQRFLITSFVVLFLTFIYSEFTEQLLWITIMPRIST